MANRHIISLDLDSTTSSKLISGVINLEEQILYIKEAKICIDQEVVAASMAETKPFRTTLIAGYNNGSIVYGIEEPLSAQNLDHHREVSMVSNENTLVDWFNVGSQGLLISISSEEPQNLNSVLPTNLKVTNNINHSSAVLIYGFHRIYPDYFETKVTGLLHIAGSMATLITLEHGKLVSHRAAYDLAPFVDDAKKEHLDKLRQLISTSTEDIVKGNNSGGFDKILFSGEIAKDALHAFADARFSAELWDLRRNAYGSSPLNFSSCNVISTYEWVIPTCGALMAAEGLGVDLSLQTDNIRRELTQDFAFQIDESLIDKLKETGIKIWESVWPAMVAQSRLLAACVLVTLGLFGYRFWISETTATQLQEQLERESQRSEGLANVKKEYNEYKATVQTINDRITAISNIRDNQLVVPTTIHELLRSTPNLISYATIDVTGRAIAATGRSNDKALAVDFFNNLALQGQFQNVIPVYDSTDPLKCEFKFDTQYRGQIASLNARAPLTQQIAKIETK